MMLSDGVGEKAHRSISLSIFGEFLKLLLMSSIWNVIRVLLISFYTINLNSRLWLKFD